MDKIKEKLHIGSSRKASQADELAGHSSNSGGHGVGTIEGTYHYDLVARHWTFPSKHLLQPSRAPPSLVYPLTLPSPLTL
jgi:hypothetical protein